MRAHVLLGFWLIQPTTRNRKLFRCEMLHYIRKKLLRIVEGELSESFVEWQPGRFVDFVWLDCEVICFYKPKKEDDLSVYRLPIFLQL